MSFCPVPHTSRDQGWLVTGALLGASAALYARRLYAARSRGQTAKRHGGPTLASADPALYPYLLEKGTRPSEPLQELFAAVEREPRARMMGSPDEAHFLGGWSSLWAPSGSSRSASFAARRRSRSLRRCRKRAR
mmetsp:Transcript_28114/g.82776  ORF Transcript_28114/g.82776 Transcript_28114/m.82776 type:complete len:134 (+) Transcript_28114:3-404(+)